MTAAPIETTLQKLTCGLVMPISAIDGCLAQHWEEVRTIIRESLESTGFSVMLVSDADEVGVIQKRIIQNLYDNAIVICDVGAKNPNVMFELGMRLAFDKPTIIIKDDQTKYSFDTAPIEHLEYPRNLHYHLIQAFKTKLREKVLATYEASKKPDYTTFLKNFGQFVVAKLDEKKVGKEDYLLAAVGELREEVRILGRMNASRDHDRGYGRPRHKPAYITDPNLWVKKYLQSLPPSTEAGKLQHLDSPEFQHAFHAFMSECVSETGLMGDAEVEVMRRVLLGALNKEL